MAVLIEPPSFSGARALSEASLGSSMLIDNRSAQSPACSISHGLASGMVFRWM